MDTKRLLPDVALDAASETQKDLFPAIDRVGMGNIEVPVLLTDATGQLFRIPARVDAKVSLDKASSRGIHMSRLFLQVQELIGKKALNAQLLREVVNEFLKSHKDLSRSAYLRVQFAAPLERKSLKSELKAWRTYPVVLAAEKIDATEKIFVEVLVTYSSTCPASAALSRQLIQDQFSREFASHDELNFTDLHQWLGSSDGILATPHAQRSEARVRVQLRNADTAFAFEDLIDVVEEALQTPVQGAVKREDEQEFALRNGQNLMFCEDASRRVKRALDRVPDVVDYLIEVKHLESLHPHNAEASIAKGIPGGLTF